MKVKEKSFSIQTRVEIVILKKKIHNYFFKVVSFSGNRHELINPSRVPTIRITMKQSRISFDHVTQKMSNGGFVYSSCGFFTKKNFFGENK